MLASIVGGAAVVVYPALIAAGVPPQVAAVSQSGRADAGDHARRAFRPHAIAAVQPRLYRLDRRLDRRRGAGAALLLLTPQRTVRRHACRCCSALPPLLFAFAEQISAWIRARAPKGAATTITFNVASLKMLLPVSFYGGYFGAGVGILILGVFSVATGGDYRSANVAKNFVSSLNGLVASMVFIIAGRGGVAADAGADGRHHRRRAGRLAISRA